MTEHHYFTCDECNKELDNVECSVKQVLYYLEVLSDTDQGFSKAHLCTVECLRLFTKKVQDHYNLPLRHNNQSRKEEHKEQEKR